MSHAYVPDLKELDEHVLVYVPEPEHPEYPADQLMMTSTGYSDSMEDDTDADSIDYPDEPEDGEEDDDEDPEEDPIKEHDPEDDDEDPEEDPKRGEMTIPREDMPPQRRFTTAPPGCDKQRVMLLTAAIEASKGTSRKRRVKLLYTSFLIHNLNRRDIRLEVVVVRGQRTAYATELQEGLKALFGFKSRLEKMESIFHISGYAVENQVKFATCTLLGAALTWWNGHVRTLGHDAAYSMT
ncbi:hypothetical protein Tco_1176171 [Tanacetum coccineum]